VGRRLGVPASVGVLPNSERPSRKFHWRHSGHCGRLDHRRMGADAMSAGSLHVDPANPVSAQGLTRKSPRQQQFEGQLSRSPRSPTWGIRHAGSVMDLQSDRVDPLLALELFLAAAGEPVAASADPQDVGGGNQPSHTDPVWPGEGRTPAPSGRNDGTDASCRPGIPARHRLTLAHRPPRHASTRSAP
jgi:hypothetical protein